MAKYLISFPSAAMVVPDGEWGAVGRDAHAVIDEAKAAGVYVFGGGLVEELEEAFSADATSGELVFRDGPYSTPDEWLGGLTIVDVPDIAAARMWAGKVAEACGWPQEVRPIK